MKNLISSILLVLSLIICISSKGQYTIIKYKKPVSEKINAPSSYLKIQGHITVHDTIIIEFQEECGPEIDSNTFNSLVKISRLDAEGSTKENFFYLFFSEEETLYKNKFYDRGTFLIYKGEKYFFSLAISDERVKLIKNDTSGKEFKKLLNEFNDKTEFVLSKGIKFR